MLLHPLALFASIRTVQYGEYASYRPTVPTAGKERKTKLVIAIPTLIQPTISGKTNHTTRGVLSVAEHANRMM